MWYTPGGVLSPLTWNLVFDELLGLLNQGPITGIGYADDGLMLISGIDPDVLTQPPNQPLIGQCLGVNLLV